MEYGSAFSFHRAGFPFSIVIFLLTGSAWANPTGPTVVNGSATFSASGGSLQITNTPNTIINWQSFSIAVGEITRFNQQSAASAVLNRVTTQTPSSILGALQSNGRIFLINPSGIVFGAGSRIDVAGLVASTLDLSNADFLAGRLRFTETPGAQPVVNDGTIATVGAGAQVYLIGPAVSNGGLITSPRGEVLLAAGNSVEVMDPGTPGISVQITAPDNQALNLGSIFADSGGINIFAGLVRQAGLVKADAIVAGDDGTIRLVSTGNVQLEAGSHTIASGDIAVTAGGNITLQSQTGDDSLRTAGAVTLSTLTPGASITQFPLSRILARDLVIDARGDVVLEANANRVETFSGTADGNVSFVTYSNILTVPGLSVAGDLNLGNAVGDIHLVGNVTSRAQSIHSGDGAILITPAGESGITIRAEGPQYFYAWRGMTIQGGSGHNAFALVSSAENARIDAPELHLRQGSGVGAWAKIKTDRRGSTIRLCDPTIGPVTWSVNGIGGAVRSGQSGFFSGKRAAVLDQTLVIIESDPFTLCP